MRIGLSFTKGTPTYRLYLGAILAAADRLQLPIETVWLASEGSTLDQEAARSIDGLLLTGGADVEPQRYGFVDNEGVCATEPHRDEAELATIDAAFSRRIPMLAICRGMQLLNVYRGGTLVPHLPAAVAHQLEDNDRHLVQIEPGTTLYHVTRSTEASATSSHHQGVEQLGRGLRASAHHADGTVEALEWSDPMRKPWMLALQWHPERMLPNETLAGPIFAAFLEAVRARAH